MCCVVDLKKLKSTNLLNRRPCIQVGQEVVVTHSSIHYRDNTVRLKLNEKYCAYIVEEKIIRNLKAFTLIFHTNSSIYAKYCKIFISSLNIRISLKKQ